VCSSDLLSSVNFLSLALSLCLTSVLAACTSIVPPGEKLSQNTTSQKHVALAFSSDRKFGAGLDATDKIILSKTERQALDYGKSGEEIDWEGRAKKVKGTIIAYQLFRVGQASCRRFEHKLFMASEIKSANGTACQRNDGSWRLVK